MDDDANSTTALVVESETETDSLIEVTTNTYNLQGRLSEVKIETYTAGIITSIVTSKFEYDAAGTKVQKIVETDNDADGNVDSSTTTSYLNDSMNFTGHSQVVEEIMRDTATLVVQKALVYLTGHDVISQTEFDSGSLIAGVALTLLYDGHGSTRFVTNVNAAIEEGYNYDAYGNAIGFDTATAMTSLLYSGEQFDSTINQLYLRQRWYNPSAGTFNRLDPFSGNMTDPQSLHKYLYTHGDPINNIDPTGLLSGGLTGLLTTITITTMATTLSGGAYGATRALLNMGTGNAEWSWEYFGTSVMRGTFNGAWIGLLGSTVLGIGLAANLAALKTLLVAGTFAGVYTGVSTYKSKQGNSDQSTWSAFEGVVSQYLGGMPYGVPATAWINMLEPSIIKTARRHNIPSKLLGTVLLAEMWHYNPFDEIGDDLPDNGLVHEEFRKRSVGLAQLRVDTIKNHHSEAKELTDSQLFTELSTPLGGIDWLAKEIAVLSTFASSGSKVSYFDKLKPSVQRDVAIQYVSAKDKLDEEDATSDYNLGSWNLISDYGENYGGPAWDYINEMTWEL